MTPATSAHRYRINEYAVFSEVELPCDTSAHSIEQTSEMPSIIIRRASLAHLAVLQRRLRPNRCYDVGDGFLLEPPSGLAMHIDYKGRTITLDVEDDNLPVACAWGIYVGLSVATLLQGRLPLHGSGLSIGGRFFSLIAASGVGKSTLAYTLLRRGALFGNDDAVPAHICTDSATAYPSISLHLKLHRTAIERYQLGTDMPAKTGSNEEEYYVPLPPMRRVLSPTPLAAIFVLRPRPLAFDGLLRVCDLANLVTARRMGQSEAAITVWQNIHADWLIGKWLDKQRIQGLCWNLAQRAPVYELSYPRSLALLPVMALTIHHTLEAL